ncbi:MAG: carboxypeptidase-like regulatory domain-containing protein [Lutibacter sp.]|uniref:carboxypeptidase-like regulatory domain-containing protein n=1 Tax=Lutibacter sp. TaxID=1925666 RepID=UPI00385EECE7
MSCFSQETSTTIVGKIVSLNNDVENVHIINLRTKHGTISNKFGEFELNVLKNDTLLISSIQYKKLKISIDKTHIQSKKIEIQLIAMVNNLNEVFLHGLSGNLNSDLNKTPIDTLPKHNFVYKLSDLNKVLPPDTHGFLKAPNAQDVTDPIMMNGAGGSASIPDYYMIKLRKLKAQLKTKKDFPSKIKMDLGIDFFTKELHIPEEKINHFLSYCEYRNIIEYYTKNNLLEVIKIVQEESKTYNEIKK